MNIVQLALKDTMIKLLNSRLCILIEEILLKCIVIFVYKNR